MINVQALASGEPVIGLDQLAGLGVDRGIGRAHHGTGNAPLKLQQIRHGTNSGTGACVAMNCSALRASACTSSNEGMRSSHSSSVAVGPMRRMACWYNFQTGSSTG